MSGTDSVQRESLVFVSFPPLAHKINSCYLWIAFPPGIHNSSKRGGTMDTQSLQAFLAVAES
ncbi:hypothetical protein, partial [uncultured Halomonas sp.]|uniref:hypothetical protein n=1 Tax=uncultured Halomonas sp. TaxID=173971 RepID=UPI0026263C55